MLLTDQSDSDVLSGAVPDDDRCFRFGDGLFETLLAIGDQILWPELHLERLSLGAQRLGIDVDLAGIRGQLEDHARQSARSATGIRVTVSRGSGPRGYCPTLGVPVRIRISSESLEVNPFEHKPPMTLALSSILMAEQPLLAGIKHCNRLEQVLAAAEAARLGVEDVLMRNSSGGLQCTSRSNFFVLRGNVLFTPSCERSGILGTRRRLVIETLAPKLGLEIKEAPIAFDELLASDDCFVSNTIIGLQSVHTLDHLAFTPSVRLTELQSAYVEELQTCLRL